MRTLRGLKRAGFALAALAFVGCDKIVQPDGSGLGEFAYSVSGALSEDGIGLATHGEALNQDFETVWVLSLAETSQPSTIVYFVRLETLPDVGEYEVTDPEGELGAGGWYAGMTISNGPQVTFNGFATLGTITIDISSPARVSGTFEIEVTGFDSSDPLTELDVTVTGQFSAIPAFVNVPAI